MVDINYCVSCKLFISVAFKLEQSGDFWRDFWRWFYMHVDMKYNLQELEAKYKVKIPMVYRNNRGYKYAKENTVIMMNTKEPIKP
jgi:hypothetical protein